MMTAGSSYETHYTPQTGYADWLRQSKTTGRAGMVSGTRYNGRGTPLKGKGCPPPDFNYERFRPCKRMIPEAAYVTKDVLGQCDYSGVAQQSYKPTKRLTAESFTSSLQGCRITNQQDVRPRSSRGHGDMNPGGNHTGDRIFGGFYEEALRSRPSTAPAASQSSMLTSQDLLPGDVRRLDSWQSSVSSAGSHQNLSAQPEWDSTVTTRAASTTGTRFGRKVDMARPPSSDGVIKYHLTASGKPDTKEDPHFALRVQSTTFVKEQLTGSFINTRQAYRDNLNKGRTAVGIF